MLSAVILSEHGYPAMPLAGQPEHLAPCNGVFVACGVVAGAKDFVNPSRAKAQSMS